ncbi:MULTISPECIES: glycine betaine/L-proline ABC transporter ATP-binding protein [Oceanobacillus]|uniref:Quaternary amine transport ATP-binding protein n=1 Tax=Oceanobacillus kimchii TaxID=746691 RepID=A0ABQ5TIP1_9BACI|nr:MULTISPECIES: glycine betaine/L-proline ABC transporter ATP-binding protein [Oceanobacillus]MBT2599290.1 glycine betaine/L-proline ABC transporter ATP-binding protein [Oceanobacillus sp. ISL-74]MBT2652208.1 glycine betaine/L-proline ABC transporter ATP-binding protein [Oceanobacillus sp. ISL-73]MCT1578510.1 glycine betaine/L-proline ABC transporter ATP-binding protein [Oceanobacillus kimchii]MCT2136441.1 glycine betaine/L-proline ABC transporter ATP-binding protein [Oceanobacillus kimchii]O
MNKIEVNQLTKIFGSHSKKGLQLLEEGYTKDEILKKSGNTVGVNNVSFDVKSGEFFVIMGLSGSGKSTLIRLINRLIEPTNGSVNIDGDDITKMNKEQLIETRRNKLGMVFQNFGLFPHRTVINNVSYGLEIQGVSKEDRKKKAYKSIEDVGLKGYENSYPNELSGGMQQRVGLARALANDTDILLMDEAFSALDPLIRKEMQDELLKLQNTLNKTILFITHDLDEALKLGDRIAIMKDGEIVQVGTSEEILENPANEYVSNFVKDVDRSKVLDAGTVMRKPEVLTTYKDGPRMAVRKMEEVGASSIFVVDRQDHYKGLLTIDDAIRSYKEDISMENVLQTEIFQTTPSTPLNDLIGIAADTKYPIAVVEEDKLVGIVSRVSILSGLVLGKENSEVNE